MRAMAVVADAVCRNPEANVYLAESIRSWPDQTDLARIVQGAGGATSVAQPYGWDCGRSPRPSAETANNTCPLTFLVLALAGPQPPGSTLENRS